MRKIIFFLLIALALPSCDEYISQEEKTTENSPYHVFVENIRGHDYVIVTFVRGNGCGISAIHAESCKCKFVQSL